MSGVYFLIRYMPFWSVPVMLVAYEFAYIYWLKKRKKMASAYFGFGCFGLICTIYYFIVGGPEASFRTFITFIRDFN